VVSTGRTTAATEGFTENGLAVLLVWGRIKEAKRFLVASVRNTSRDAVAGNVSADTTVSMASANKGGIMLLSSLLLLVMLSVDVVVVVEVMEGTLSRCR